MIRKSEKNRIRILLVLTALLFAAPAYAYVDPNTTSLISQSLTPFFVIGATIIMFFREKAVMALQWLSRCISRLTHGATE
jgi:hypothetical protein